jgi:hypothetical protein
MISLIFAALLAVLTTPTDTSLPSIDYDLCELIALEVESAVEAYLLTSEEAEEILSRCN